MATAMNSEDFPVRMVGLRSLTLDPDLQSRCKTDIGHARAVTDFVLKNGPISEPIVVFDDTRNLWVADGVHRVSGYREAARVNLRFKSIRAEIRPGTRDDAIVFLAGANQDKTYLKRTPGDIKRAFFMLMNHPKWSVKSATSIGKAVGIEGSASQRYWVEYFASRNQNPPDMVEDSKGRRTPSGYRRPRSQDSPKITKQTSGGLYTKIDGKTIYLGANTEDSESRLREIMNQDEAKRLRYEDVGPIVKTLVSRFIHSENGIDAKDNNGLPGIFGRKSKNVAFTWESFREKNQAVSAAGRAIWLRDHLQAERAIVLCPVEDGPKDVLDGFRKLGVEWLTIEEFVESLKVTE